MSDFIHCEAATKLKDILPERPVGNIMVRTNAPHGYPHPDMLFGCCRWDGKDLISLDGDSYSVDWSVTKYEWESDDSLVSWIESEWT